MDLNEATQPLPEPPEIDSAQVRQAIADEAADWKSRRINRPSLAAPQLSSEFMSFPDPPGSPPTLADVSTEHPFKVRVNLSTLAFTVLYGTVRGVVPTLGGTALGTLPAPTGTMTGTGIEKVYLQVNVTLTKTSDNTYVRSWNFDSVIVDVATVADIEDVPVADDLIGGTYYFELATFVDGVKIEPQPVGTSLGFLIEDDQTGTGGGQIYWN